MHCLTAVGLYQKIDIEAKLYTELNAVCVTNDSRVQGQFIQTHYSGVKISSLRSAPRWIQASINRHL